MKYIDRIRYNRIVRVLFILTPFVMGLIGYYRYYAETGAITSAPLSALYSAIRLFGFSFDAVAGKERVPAWTYCILEISRYWAAFLTGSALFKIIKPYLEDLLTVIKAHARNSIVLHGSPSITSVMKNHMDGFKVIEQNDSRERFKSRQHVIAFENDSDALQFLQSNYEQFCRSSKKQKPTVYLCVHSPEYQLASDASVKVSCMAENCARQFWEENYIERFGDGCAQNKHTASQRRQKIVLIGFDTYGQSLLTQALLVNVFPKKTPGVEYHIFGCGVDYLNKHPNLSRIVSFEEDAPLHIDYVRFYERSTVFSNRALFAEAERIILCSDSDEENYQLFSQLCRMTALPAKIFIRSKSDQITNGLYLDNVSPRPGDALYRVQFKTFGTDAALYTKNIIINKSLEMHAREIHKNYMNKFGAYAWEKIGTVKQHSNFAAADHFAVKIRQVLRKDCPIDKDASDEYCGAIEKAFANEERKKELLEMEHLRWCRFYYLSGWFYAPEKNEALRLHDCLTDFSALSEETTRNDAFAYEVIKTMKFQ